MSRHPILTGALLGGITSLPLMGLFYLGNQVAGLPFVPFDLFEWLSRILPGGVVIYSIEAMVKAIVALRLGAIDSVAKALEQTMAAGLGLVVGILVGICLAWIIRRASWSGDRIGLAAGVVLLLPTIALELTQTKMGDPALGTFWIAVLIVGWATLLGQRLGGGAKVEGVAAVTDGYQPGRRAALVKIAGWSLVLALASWAPARFLEEQRRGSGAGRALTGATSVSPTTVSPTTVSPTPVAQRIEPAPGTRPEVTPIDSFYRIDIDLAAPTVVGSSWSLDVKGLFDRPRSLTLSDLKAYPAVTQPITISCISNPVAGDLIGTGFWTGVRIAGLLNDLGLRPEATELRIEAADGFYESVSLADLQDPRTLLVYGMDGEALPENHGFPLRIYIPNRYGMKQPKWITRIEATNKAVPGYWVERGWSREARPQIISVIDTVATDRVVDGKVALGGIAWAGDRGIQKVEVQVDDGPWQPATLRLPPVGSLTWVQWRYDWPLATGKHTFKVRATDGTGAPQIEMENDTFPDGATGYHYLTKTI